MQLYHGSTVSSYIHTNPLSSLPFVSPRFLIPLPQCRHCRRPIGSYTWTPTPRQRLYGRLEAPIFRIHKGVVHLADVPLDATPLNTPRQPNQDNATPAITTATDNNNSSSGHIASHGLGSPGVAMMPSSSHHHHHAHPHTAMMSDDDKPQPQQQHRWGPSLSSK